MTIGVGHSCEELTGIGQSYRSALDALGYKAIVGTGKTIYINDVEPVNRGKLRLEPKDEAELAAAVKFGTPETIRLAVHSLVARMGGARVHARQYQLYKLSMVNGMIQLLQQYDMAPGDFLEQDRYMELLGDPEHLEEFEEWFFQLALRLNEGMNRERDNTTRKVILEAKEYIQEHYKDPDLSVEMICRQLHMSPAYFSTLFKRETGQTYVAYLTDIRLGKAVELLNETDDKTYVIARKVGYQEQNYFSYVFKKKFGVSPTKYRSPQTPGTGK